MVDLAPRSAALTSPNGREPPEGPEAPVDGVWSHDALLSAELPTPRELIAEVLDEETVLNLAGPPAAGKTWLELAAARAMASGGAFLDHFPTVQGGVLVVDQESHLSKLQERLRMLDRADPLPAGTPLHLTVQHACYLDDPAGYARLDGWLRTYRPVVAFLDSFTRFHRASENDAGEMSDVHASIRQLVQDHQTAFVLLDHTRKKSLINEPEERLRGSIEKRAFVDTALDLEATKPPDPLITVTMTKRRYGPPLVPFAVALQVDNAAGTARLTYQGAAARDQGSRRHEVVGAVQALKQQLGADGADVRAVGFYLEASEATARRWLGEAVKAGLVRSRQVGKTGGRPRQVYDVAGGGDA